MFNSFIDSEEINQGYVFKNNNWSKNSDKKLLLTKKETAKELGISESTLDRIRNTGEIRAKKIGGGIFFTINEISLFLGELK